MLRGGDCFGFLIGFVFENAQGGEIVFDFLEGHEHRLAIIIHRLVPRGFGLIGRATAGAALEQSFRGLSSEHPETAGPLQQRGEHGAFEAAGAAEGDLRIICGAGDADLRVLFLHAPFRGGNVGAAFEQV